MSQQLLEGLDLPARLLLQFAAQREHVPLRVAMTPPLEADPFEAVEALQERGLVAPAEYPGVFSLTPMGYALREEIVARWPEVHQDLRKLLVEHLDKQFDLGRKSRLLRALKAIDRAHFVSEPAQVISDLDIPAPTGADDMNTSAPHAIVSILQAVAPRKGDRVLVCGAKGGVTLALAAHMAGEEGHGVALDWSPETVAHVRRALSHYPELDARTEAQECPDVTVGYEEGAPWQVVVVNGSIPKIPWPLIEQLDGNGGRMLFFLQEPENEGQSCYVLLKNGDVVRNEALSRFVFTPIYGRYGWDRVAEIQ
jgi:protein-L-isoaspartate(D-aspartate) O-methyltransferase